VGTLYNSTYARLCERNSSNWRDTLGTIGCIPIRPFEIQIITVNRDSLKQINFPEMLLFFKFQKQP